MEFLRLLLDENYGNYSYSASFGERVQILSFFLTDDVGNDPSTFKEWGLADK